MRERESQRDTGLLVKQEEQSEEEQDHASSYCMSLPLRGLSEVFCAANTKPTHANMHPPEPQCNILTGRLYAKGAGCTIAATAAVLIPRALCHRRDNMFEFKVFFSFLGV